MLLRKQVIEGCVTSVTEMAVITTWVCLTVLGSIINHLGLGTGLDM